MLVKFKFRLSIGGLGIGSERKMNALPTGFYASRGINYQTPVIWTRLGHVDLNGTQGWPNQGVCLLYCWCVMGLYTLSTEILRGKSNCQCRVEWKRFMEPSAVRRLAREHHAFQGSRTFWRLTSVEGGMETAQVNTGLLMRWNTRAKDYQIISTFLLRMSHITWT